MAKRLGFGLCLIVMWAMLVCTAFASIPDGECEVGLYYTGDLFDKFGGTQFCAQVGCPCECSPTRELLSGAGLWFQATSLWGIPRTNGPFTTVLTNSVGEACVKYNINPGVFEVQAFGAEGGPLEGIVSPPVAVTTFSYPAGKGIAAGGAIILDTCKERLCDNRPEVLSTPPNGDGEECGCIDYTCRKATFGLIYDCAKPQIDPKRLLQSAPQGLKPIEFELDIPLPDCKNEQLLFLDPCNPEGPVKIKVTNFRNATLPVLVHINPWPFWFYVRFEGLKFTGYAQVCIGDGEPQTKYFEAVLTNNFKIFSSYPYFKVKDTDFKIRVFDYPGAKNCYEAAGVIQDGGCTIF